MRKGRSSRSCPALFLKAGRCDQKLIAASGVFVAAGPAEVPRQLFAEALAAADFLFHHMADLAASRVGLLDRHADADGTGRLVGNSLLDADRVGFGLGLRNDLAHIHGVLLLVVLRLANRDADGL